MKNVLVMAVLLFTASALAEVRITFRDGSIFQCEKLVRRTSSVLVVEKDGKRLSIQTKLVKSVEDVKPPAPAPVNLQPAQAVAPEETGNRLILTDANVVRTVPVRRYPRPEQPEVEEAPPVTISVITQQVSREEGTVRFEGTLRNDLGDTANTVRMTVRALDTNGEVVAQSSSQVAASMAVGATVPFSFQFADATGSIARFTYQFEGVVGGTNPQ